MMAIIDTTVDDQQFNSLTATTTAWKNKLEPLRSPLAAVLGNEAQRQKAVTAIKTSEDYRLLKHTWQTWRWLTQFFEDIGWEKGDD
jgi:hypothetical protein